MLTPVVSARRAATRTSDLRRVRLPCSSSTTWSA
jgi:hypothetical protein